jgi:hypothetical protein
MPTPGDTIPGILRSGTIEYLLVRLGDHLEFIENIGPLNPMFTIYDPEDTIMQGPVAADVDAATPMTARCNVDTSTGGNWPSNRYRLFLSFSAAPEFPILGPVIFRVEEL